VCLLICFADERQRLIDNDKGARKSREPQARRSNAVPNNANAHSHAKGAAGDRRHNAGHNANANDHLRSATRLERLLRRYFCFERSPPVDAQSSAAKAAVAAGADSVDEQQKMKNIIAKAERYETIAKIPTNVSRLLQRFH
jgi:hypothetical protein